VKSISDLEMKSFSGFVLKVKRSYSVTVVAAKIII
jgi:hypothetical protein